MGPTYLRPTGTKTGQQRTIMHAKTADLEASNCAFTSAVSLLTPTILSVNGFNSLS